MAAVVKYLHSIDGRWKYRRVVPERLRAHIDGNIREFVRWLGAAKGQPSPEVLRKYVSVGEEFEALVAMAEKRASGQYDELTEDLIEHFIATVRSHMLEEDEEGRFDESEDDLHEAVRQQLEGDSRAKIADIPDRRWAKRQEGIDRTLEAWRADLARGHISDFVKEELLDRAEGYGLRLAPGSLGFRRLAGRFLQLLVEYGDAAQKRQEGNLVPTPKPPAPMTPEKRRGLPDQTITGLVEGWWKEAKAAGRSLSTLDAYSRTARQFADFLKHDDANALSKQDVIAFKDHRLEQGKSLKTIRDGDLAALKALFEWAVANGRMASNPAKAVKIITPKRNLSRSKGFTDAEAEAILMHAMHHKGATRAAKKTAAAKRWVPWLCAYTGARVGEMVQLRREDVRQEGNAWVLTLSPDAGTIKGKVLREVPVHHHLVEVGFIEFVLSAPAGFLFLNPTGDTEEKLRAARRTIKNRLVTFVREVAADPNVQPNHGWRHRFETLARECGLREDVTNAITGHATPGVAASYGNVTLAAKIEAIAKIPRVAIQRIT